MDLGTGKKLIKINITKYYIFSDIHSAFQSVNIKIPHVINALSGFLLVITVPEIPTPEVINELDVKMKTMQLFLFPLSTLWIIAYSVWNATFSYGFGFSMTTRLILITSILVSHLFIGTSSTWLECRCLSLMLNMVLRANNALYVYTPGKSILTHKHREPISPSWLFFFSVTSLVISMFTFYFQSNDSILLSKDLLTLLSIDDE